MDRWLNIGSCSKRTISQVASDPGEPGPSNRPSLSVQKPAKANAKKQKTGFRKYSPDYLKYGFTFIGTEEEPVPQCVICFETLANESMKPSKLERHISTKHPECLSKSLSFFQNKRKELLSTRSNIEKISLGHENKKISIVSYQLSLLIAKKGVAHTTGENLILPAAKIISSNLFDEKATKQIGEIPLSNNTVKRRIDEMSANVKEQLITALQHSAIYSLQLDESTDIADNANLLAFVRFELNGSVEEEMLFCKSLPTSTTSEEIFKCLDGFMVENQIDWSKCVGLTTDGARAMSGKYTGLAARVKAVAPLVEWTHCSIHREALAMKGMSQPLKTTLDKAVKIVNFIKSQPKNSRLFSVLCDEMGSDHQQLLLHCEVRWLSRGKVLSRLFELRDEVRLFLTQLEDEGKPKASAFLQECLDDETWLIKLSYLADIFSSLNILNLTLQGKDVHKFFVQDKVDATIKKLERWCQKVQNKIFDPFPLMNEFLDFNDLKVDEQTRQCVIEHLEALASNLRRYFPAIDEGKKWIQNPFHDENLKKASELTPAQEDILTELSCDSVMKNVFREKNLVSFWMEARSDYASLSKEAMNFLMIFTTTYLCERSFSTLVFLKNKYRNKLDVESDLRLKLSSFEPDIDSLVQNKQCQKSH